MLRLCSLVETNDNELCIYFACSGYSTLPYELLQMPPERTTTTATTATPLSSQLAIPLTTSKKAVTFDSEESHPVGINPSDNMILSPGAKQQTSPYK